MKNFIGSIDKEFFFEFADYLIPERNFYRNLVLSVYDKGFIHKDKIRAKIKEFDGLKEIDKSAYEEQVKPLLELLEDKDEMS